ncbi:hypothetical protein [Actinophytocola sp.]|jgi:hypothetical protein|uniref:hypothetical protein n=1 Tax=Actinophytocola sp. TaxID=1872138 RepID=UPI002D359D05|nr:hypothetical protein [Actinophytocola sp.]HYQ62197.1 hypothetical protein [Actinophytocola sp.]
MPAVAWVTLVAAALIIGLTAVALLRVIVHLRHVTHTLDAVIGGVESIADRTSTVPARLTSVNANLKPVREWAEGV